MQNTRRVFIALRYNMLNILAGIAAVRAIDVSTVQFGLARFSFRRRSEFYTGGSSRPLWIDSVESSSIPCE